MLISIGELLTEKRKLSCAFSSHVVLFSEDKTDWYIEQDDIERITEHLIALGKKDPRLDKRLLAAWEDDKQAFYAFCRRIKRRDLSLLPLPALSTLYEECIGAYTKAISSSSLSDGFALGSDELIKEKLTAFLSGKGLSSYQYRHFTTLTAPVTPSFINAAEISLLNIAAVIQKEPGLVRRFRKQTVPQLMAWLARPEAAALDAMLTHHEERYFWSKNNYVDDHVLDRAHFVTELKGLIEGDVDAEVQARRIRTTPEKNRRAKEKLLSELDPPPDIRFLLTLSDAFTYWQDERKKMTYWMTHYLSRILDPIAARTGYTLDELKYMIVPEIQELVRGDGAAPSRMEAAARKGFALFYHKGDSYAMLSGTEAKAMRERIMPEEELSSIDDFRGLPACRGVVRGRVRLVMSAREAGNVQKDEILVAVMTRPDYIAGIKQAAAIVTDEGGVTCHAAIVSRELGKPCVIGTKIATKALKDGMEVEVNANHGVVTILSRT